ncbi:hypothetical protein [Desertimonas flava]|uniref:hypothetical protein n=1 Tax=Desertimonas flava TaxID=2064846 RepID=UPI000E346D69|nr:hypothetical protein [Desertimonas flava]
MNGKRIRDGVLALAIGFGLGTAAIEADGLRTLFRSGDRLGDVDFFRYCNTRFDDKATASLVGDDASSWRCVIRDPILNFVNVNVDDACSRQYDVPAKGRFDDPEDPYSWECSVR